MSNVTKTAKTCGPYIMTYTSEGDVAITQTSARPLLATPMVVGERDARTVTPVAVMPVWAQTDNYDRDMELADRAADAFVRVLDRDGVEGFVA